MPYELVLGITTYNRSSKLKRLLESFAQTADFSNNWQIIIADDGSTDGTIEYIENLNIPGTQISLIKNNRQGVHHQFNTIVRKLKDLEFDYCFKCDDDIQFIKPGWEKLYIDAIEETGYDHLCHFDPTWRPEKNFKKPIKKGRLISYCQAKDVQGAFFTLTTKVINGIGYMDTKNFGFRGVGHIDYTIRACRAGFNDINHPFDVINSNDYIAHQKENYSSAINNHILGALERSKESRRKYELIEDQNRLFIPYYKDAPSLDQNTERDLLIMRLEDLEDQLNWYKITYDHQPRWLVRLGKLLKLMRNQF